MKMTLEQRLALVRKWQQSDQDLTFYQFQATATKQSYDTCIMVPWCGMWLGIETDGYTHS